jgi:hypothetical protein
MVLTPREQRELADVSYLATNNRCLRPHVFLTNSVFWLTVGNQSSEARATRERPLRANFPLPGALNRLDSHPTVRFNQMSRQIA